MCWCRARVERVHGWGKSGGEGGGGAGRGGGAGAGMGAVWSCLNAPCCAGDGGARAEEEAAAATKIQAAYRGNKVRKSGSGSSGSGRAGSFAGKFD